MSSDPVIPAKAGIQSVNIPLRDRFKAWIPAFAGMTGWDFFLSTFLFFGFFALYLHTSAPQLAPYRDAGEMSSLLSTLSVAHPPGYPLYTLAGRIATLVPIGNVVFRINAFSALCAAMALVFLFLSLRVWLAAAPAALAACFLGFSNPFWDLATVSEMYALGTLFFCGLLFVAFRLKDPLLFSFLMALGLGVRMDMLLLIPIFLWWFWLDGRRREYPLMACCFALGASIFLYLMFRSLTNPVIDWANPDNLLAVLNSARRKNYSGTLDLLSLSYRSGENFAINLKLYWRHLVSSFGWWGVIAAAAGLIALWRGARKPALVLIAIFVVTGPVFLYLANMPPNPHAVAIVEASYLVPDIMIAVFIGWGLSLSSFRRKPESSPSTVFKSKFETWIPAFAGMTAVALLVVNAMSGAARGGKRHNLYARDFVENVFRSLPRGAVAVFHKDVQLFSLWSAQLVDGRRPDLSLVSAGLSGSEWYWQMRRRWKAAPSPEISLKERGGWMRLISELGPRPLFAGYDADVIDRDQLKLEPHGLVMSVRSADVSAPTNPTQILPALCLYRGKYVYEGTPDFFSTDLIGDHARAHHQRGFHFMMAGDYDRAEWFLRRAESLDPTFGRASSDRGYVAYLKNDVPKAYARYEAAVRKLDETLRRLDQYKTLPETANSYRAEASAANTQWGAMAERLGRRDEARALYLRALNIQENAQAHYNLAVTYWAENWEQVIVHMRRALELNPRMQDAQAYLAKALAMAGKK